MRPRFVAALIAMFFAGCTDASPLVDFKRDNPFDLGNTDAPPSFVASTYLSDTTRGVSWGTVGSGVISVVVERKFNKEPFVRVTEVDRSVHFASVPVPVPGAYTFRVASRLADKSLSAFIYTGTFTIP